MERDMLRERIEEIAEKRQQWKVTAIAKREGAGHVTGDMSNEAWIVYECARNALIDELCKEAGGENEGPNGHAVEALAYDLAWADMPGAPALGPTHNDIVAKRDLARVLLKHFGR